MPNKISFKKMTLDQVFELEDKYSTTLGNSIATVNPKREIRVVVSRGSRNQATRQNRSSKRVAHILWKAGKVKMIRVK